MASIPIGTPVMAPLRDVLHQGIVVGPQDGDTFSDSVVRVAFTPPVPVEPSGSITYLTCSTADVTLGWF